MPRYSKEQFEGYTHRFMVYLYTSPVDVPEGWRDHVTITLYSDDSSIIELEKFIEERKNNKVTSFKVIHRASKEQDEATSRFLKDLNW